MPRRRPRFVALVDLVTSARTDRAAAIELIAQGHVQIDGRIVDNPRARVPATAAVVIRPARQLRGGIKLAAALEQFAVSIRGRIALDVGAAAGGFTTVLLAAGASRVYAVDAGFGQLLGSLRADRRVVNLERHNLGELDGNLIVDPIGVVTADVSYLSIAAAVPQLEVVKLDADCDLIALVKPMYELRAAAAPTAPEELRRALRHACAGIAAAGWTVQATMRSPVRGARGTVEFLVHARRGTRRAS
jgi:23S rRNA (cytidine1920-2'-O)/16S rRNA (cytidine1409-2'-O)-methyltransferase